MGIDRSSKHKKNRIIVKGDENTDAEDQIWVLSVYDMKTISSESPNQRIAEGINKRFLKEDTLQYLETVSDQTRLKDSDDREPLINRTGNPGKHNKPLIGPG